MKRKLIISATAAILFIMGIGSAFAISHTPTAVDQTTYQRSPDCKYPPCD